MGGIIDQAPCAPDEDLTIEVNFGYGFARLVSIEFQSGKTRLPQPHLSMSNCLSTKQLKL
jgi:hypothetical protein